MAIKKIFNDNWKFFYGDIESPAKTVRKAGAIGGYTSVVQGEKGESVPLGAGGHFFLNLISGGNEKIGLKMLAGTNLDVSMEGWENVNLPHDFKTDLPYVNSPELLMSGSKPNGIAYYRKSFSLEEDVKGKKISVYFEGVCRSASVWFNGFFLGDHYSGYTGFDFDISDMARYGDEGENVIFVRVDMTTGSEGWWYDGAGIYRNVHLIITENIHFDPKGIYVETQRIDSDKAILKIETEIANRGYEEKKVSYNLSIYKGDTFQAGFEKKDFRVESLSTFSDAEDFEILNPNLWSPDSPSLYRAVLELKEGDEILDSHEVNFGIREILYTTEGLFINGKHTEIKGVCEHQDFAIVGTAVTKEIIRYKLELLKEMGVNAYRSAHHAASEDLLNLCDEMGIMVMEENRVLESSELHIKDVVDMVLKDRNHPSIFCWSLSNEEVIGSTPVAERMAAHIAAVIRKYDKSRFLVSAELLSPEGIISENYLDIFDVIGVNYPESPVMGDGLANIKKKFPDKPIMSTESASYFSTRGKYVDNWDKCHTSNYGSCYSMFSPEPLPVDAPGAGGTAHPETVIEFYKNRPYMGGSFIWTAFDYYGEPAPFHWPAISSQFGIMDICGFKKDYYYYYKSKWTSEPLVHGMPHWNHQGSEGKEIELRVFSNCQEAEVILNSKSLGKKACGEHSTSWLVKYEPGVLEIKGYNDGKEVATEVKKTTDEAKVLNMEFLNVSDEEVLVEITALDIEGNEVPDAENEIKVTVENGILKGTSGGDPSDHAPNKSGVRKLFSGKLLAIVSRHPDKKDVIIKATADDLNGTERIWINK